METSNTTWTNICAANDLTPNAGICALYNEQQVAIFLCKQTNNVYAVANYDPFGGANVLSRGLIGSTQDIIYVASPLYKQRFNLSTGECLDSPDHKLKTYNVRIENDQVQLKEAS
ncbi:nitrite reductase (NAD(P)H) small subunit [Psychromonas sp. B3M02]|uniref:nitrite reductase small subunit NirD n=1 Tax=Psychromonas sp. B3M02 TaxID=2267226 RepID=UPI000DEB27EF|nr:nitrite reductase small subunit NirD [Psychromonas sp. B3M02]RBW46982.1 nitrite reductase (NAD(P)H) small subunit [Psychromonas sp. B3M02]